MGGVWLVNQIELLYLIVVDFVLLLGRHLTLPLGPLFGGHLPL